MSYIAIITKYHAPTGTRGARISATWGDDRITVPYDNTDGAGGPAHRKAAEAICEQCGHAGLAARLIEGSLPNGRFVFVVSS